MVEHGATTPTDRILDISFNQDQGCFAVSTENGFSIYNSYPFKDTFQRNFDSGIGITSMLFRSNILALVGGGAKPKYSPKKVVLWDDHQSKIIGELSFKSEIKAVKLRKDRVVVGLEQRTYIYNLSDLKLLDAVDTYDNPQGLCAISSKDDVILVVPDKQKGHIHIIDYNNNINLTQKAHESYISALGLNQDGKVCATASDKGTLVRVFSTKDGTLIQELRRGMDKADIHSISFDSTCSWLACTSDKGTVHIFSLNEAHKLVHKEEDDSEETKSPSKNPKSAFKFMKGLFSYFKSEWSFAQFRISDVKSVVAFGPSGKNEIIGIY